MLMIVLMSMANFMQVLDLSVANVALPHISGDLGVSVTEGTWVITSYAVANAIAVPLAGWLARRFGQVRVFAVALGMFTFSSWLCGISFSLAMLITARILQGLCAGLMIPMSQALMLNNSPPHRRVMALAAWSMTTTVGPVIGPLLGGWITDNSHWAWIFFINIPAGTIATVGVWHLMRDRETPTVKVSVDTVGLMLLILWVGALQIMFDKGNELDWFGSGAIIALAVVGFVGFCVFIAWELTEKNPIVDLTLFKFHNFRVGMVALGLGFGVFFANVVMLPLLLQSHLGYTAAWAGRITAPMGVCAVIFAPIVGKLMSKIDPRVIATFGFFIYAVTSYWRTDYTVHTPVLDLALPQLLQGIGIACFFLPLVTINTGGIPPDRMPTASGLQNFGRMMLGSFGVSLSITFWNHRAALHRVQLVEALPDHGTRLNEGLGLLRQGGLSDQLAYGQIMREIDVQAHMLAANDIFLMSAVIFALLMGVIWFTKPPFGGGTGGH